MSISFSHSGGFDNFEKFAKKAVRRDYLGTIDRYAQEGVRLLSEATPVDSGLTAKSWAYEVHKTKNTVEIIFTNSNLTSDRVPIALLIQTGHVTRNGGYVQGKDYINPALRKTFDKLAENLWKELTS